jgi:hypothetical protein
MNWRIPLLLVSLLTTLVTQSSKVSAQIAADLPADNPQAIVDLATSAGTSLVKGQWRYRDTQIVPVNFRRPGADRKASGAPNQTFETLRSEDTEILEESRI